MNPRTPPPPDDAHTPVADLYCDEFHSGRSYHTHRSHGSGDWLLIYTVGGAGLLRTGHGSRITVPGDAVLYGPGDFQDYGTNPEPGDWHILWAHFAPRPQRNIWLRWPLSREGLKLLHFDQGEMRTRFASAMRRMLTVSRRQVPFASDLASNALEEALLWAAAAASGDAWLAMDPRIRNAIDHLAENMKQPFALAGLARRCGLSVSRLVHLFTENTGVSPRSFLEQRRMQHASQLLRLTSLTVTEIAAEVGYPDPFYFSNRFRRHAGASPSAFRKQSAAQPRK